MFKAMAYFNVELHERLIDKQPDAELERKWAKAQGRYSNNYWTQEELDLSDREAKRLTNFFNDITIVNVDIDKLLAK